MLLCAELCLLEQVSPAKRQREGWRDATGREKGRDGMSRLGLAGSGIGGAGARRILLGPNPLT